MQQPTDVQMTDGGRLGVSYEGHMRRGLAAIERAWRNGLGVFDCYTSSQRTFDERTLVSMENFTVMVVLDLLTGVAGADGLNQMMAEALAARMRPDGVFHFFVDRDAIPADADCTANGVGALLRYGLIDEGLADAALSKLLTNVDGDGVVATYLDASPRRRDIVDPVVCLNVLYLAALRDRLPEAAATRAFVEDVLRDGLYAFGTRYYPRPENFLWFLARLVTDFPDAFEKLVPEVRAALVARRGVAAGPLDRAQWLAALARLGEPIDAEMSAFMALQRPDGTWPIGAFFRYGRSGIFFGTEMVTTAMAVAAIHTHVQRQRH